MLQVNYIRENREKVLERLSVRNFKQPELVDEIINIDEERRQFQTSLDNLSAAANASAKQIGELMRNGKREEADVLKAQTSANKEQHKSLSDQLAAAETKLQNLIVQLPNLPHHLVKPGSSAEENETVYEHGEPALLPANALPHWELTTKYDIIDFELGTKITGAGFPVYKGKGAKLQRALINFFLDRATEKGYREMQVPLLVNEASGYGTGQLPDKEGRCIILALTIYT
jgi:seryl-tRNA synthetase